ATITFKADGTGKLKFGNKEVPCVGMPGVAYPKAHEVNAIEGQQWDEKADKYRLWRSAHYGRARMPWSVRLVKDDGIFIHEFPDGVPSHGCIHLSP
ncbi:unnamed protein product, partial [Phaeothamnion confervicola]